MFLTLLSSSIRASAAASAIGLLDAAACSTHPTVRRGAHLNFAKTGDLSTGSVIARCGYSLGVSSSPERTAWAAAGPRGEVQLAKDVGDVPVHGVLADDQPLGDLAVGESLGEQPEHLSLARGHLG